MIDKNTRFDIFYNGTEYMDHINVSIEDLYEFIGTWSHVIMGVNHIYKYGEDIGWYAPRNYRTLNIVKLYNYVKIAKEYLNYIVCIHGEMEREPFRKQELHGESSLLKQVYGSNYIEKQEKARKKYMEKQRENSSN